MEERPTDGPKVVFMHGFTQEEALAAMRAVKAANANPGELAFAMSTESNMDWTVRKLVGELAEEWEYFKTHKPGEA